jgi:hypothetical protein
VQVEGRKKKNCTHCPNLATAMLHPERACLIEFVCNHGRKYYFVRKLVMIPEKKGWGGNRLKQIGIDALGLILH